MTIPGLMCPRLEHIYTIRSLTPCVNRQTKFRQSLPLRARSSNYLLFLFSPYKGRNRTVRKPAENSERVLVEKREDRLGIHQRTRAPEIEGEARDKVCDRGRSAITVV